MLLPFSRAQFLDAFAHYNHGVWPSQLVLFAVGVTCGLMALENRGGSRGIGVLVGLMWAWTGLTYHLMYFTPINGAAWLFAGACLVTASSFTAGGMNRTLVFERPEPIRAIAGTTFMAYGAVGYPLVAHGMGLELARIPTLGLPCPTTIFTLGLLLFARRPIPLGVLVVPFAWCIVGTIAAFSFGMYADLALPVAGLVTVWFLCRPRYLRAATARGEA